MAVRRLIKGH